MRRPHRSIEVFDISLMAVVTKAMGAFLVLMLLLIPYYSSGSLGDQAAADVAKQLAEAEQQLKALSSKLNGMNPQAIAQALQQAQQHLAEANRNLSALKRANDALNAQAQRLDSENTGLRDQVGKLAAEQNKIRVDGMLTSWDCNDARIVYGIIQPEQFIQVGKDGKLNYVLNHQLSLGSQITTTDDDILRMFPTARSLFERGHGQRFDSSAFRYDADTGDYYVVVATTAKEATTIDGMEGSHVLKHVAADCHALIGLRYYVPSKKSYEQIRVHEMTIPKNAYAIMPFMLRVDGEKVSYLPSDKRGLDWLQDQVAHAQKAATPAGGNNAANALDLNAEAKQLCYGRNVPDEQRFRGCTAVIRLKLESPSHMATAFFNRGVLYAGDGKNNEAIQDFNEAIRLKPDYAEAIKKRADVLAKKGTSPGGSSATNANDPK